MNAKGVKSMRTKNTIITAIITVMICSVLGPLQTIEGNASEFAISLSVLPVSQNTAAKTPPLTNPLPPTAVPIIDVPTVENDHLVYYAFNIGQADCHLIELNGHYMMIDTGLSNASPDSQNANYLDIGEVKEFLKKKKIKKLDYLIITHYDGDHIGGMLQLLGYKTKTKKDDIAVEKFISRRHTKETLKIMKDNFAPKEMLNTQYRNYLKLINTASQNIGKKRIFTLDFEDTNQVISIKNVYKEADKLKSVWLSPKQGETLYFADKKVTLQFLSPTKSFITKANLETRSYPACVNNDSLVFKLIYQGQSILFTGDIDKDACMNIINYTSKKKNTTLYSTILKVPHHGVNANFYDEKLGLDFMKQVCPAYSIITCARYFKPLVKQCSLSNEAREHMGALYRTDMIGKKSIAICSIINSSGTISMKKLLLSKKQYYYNSVQSWEYPISQIIAPETFDLAIGQSKKFPAMAICRIGTRFYEPTVNLLSYQSENSSIASVNQHGYVTGKKIGSTNIIIQSLDGTLNQWVCKITVLNPIDTIAPKREPVCILSPDNELKKELSKKKKLPKKDKKQ